MAWCDGDTPPQTPPDTLSADPLELDGEHTALLHDSPSSYLNVDTDINTAHSFESFTHLRTARDDLVVVVAEGMTSQLTYDGIDVCASRVAWEVG